MTRFPMLVLAATAVLLLQVHSATAQGRGGGGRGMSGMQAGSMPAGRGMPMGGGMQAGGGCQGRSQSSMTTTATSRATGAASRTTASMATAGNANASQVKLVLQNQVVQLTAMRQQLAAYQPTSTAESQRLAQMRNQVGARLQQVQAMVSRIN
jgi:hypothetical protein